MLELPTWRVGRGCDAFPWVAIIDAASRVYTARRILRWKEKGTTDEPRGAVDGNTRTAQHVRSFEHVIHIDAKRAVHAE